MATVEYNRAKRLKIESFHYLDEILRYDACTGRLIWKTLFPGKIAGTVIHNKNSHTKYLKLALERLDFKAHRLCWILYYGEQPPEGTVIDHIDGDGLNNRMSNLRLCHQRNNSRNSKKPVSNTSGFKGVRSVKGSPRFQAFICVNRVQRHLGMYDTPEEAFAAYCSAARTIFGEYACTTR